MVTSGQSDLVPHEPRNADEPPRQEPPEEHLHLDTLLDTSRNHRSRPVCASTSPSVK